MSLSGSVRSKAAVLASAFVLVLGGAVGSGITGVSAHQADVEVQADCKGSVTFTVRSWSTGPEGANERIGVYQSVNGKQFRPVAVEDGPYAFTASNGNEFTDTFQVADHEAGDRVTVKTKALAPWGNGNEDAAEKTATVELPAPCNPSPSDEGDTTTRAPVAVTTTTVTPPAPPAVAETAVTAAASATVQTACDSDLVGWTVRVRNDDATERAFAVTVDGSTVATIVVPGETETARRFGFRDHGITSGEQAVVAVTAPDGAELAVQTVTNDCAGAVVTIEQACDTSAGSGAVLSFTNTGRVDEAFTVLRDGRPVAGSPVTVPAGSPTIQKMLRLSEGESAAFVVTGSPSGLAVTRTVTLDCVEVLSEALVPTAQVEPASLEAAPVVEATASPDVVDRASMRLAGTGAPVGMGVAVGTALMAMGLVLGQASRRIRRKG